MKSIKFDTLYPNDYIKKKLKESANEIKRKNFKEFHNWVINLRMNFSDFYTYNLSLYGWDAQEIFLGNSLYLRKCARYYFGFRFHFIDLYYRVRNKIFSKKKTFYQKLITEIVKKENPDIIYVRENSGIRSEFWSEFKKDKLVVSRMDCGLPANWSPLDFDLIYTNVISYENFFNSNRIPTYSNHNGFDPRVLNEINKKQKIYDVVFVGGLGNPTFTEKTSFFESLLNNYSNSFSFKWWGFKEGKFEKDYPELNKKYMGTAAGIDMFNIYAQSKIVINDYGIISRGKAVNQRIYEVLGVGSLLLTRETENLKDWNNYIVTFKNVKDCIEKIRFYLKNDYERDTIAKSGHEYILSAYNYKELMKKMSDELTYAYNKKFKK